MPLASGDASAITGYLRDRSVPSWRKFLGILAILYAVWPFDAVPDVVPLVGWLDDLGVLGVISFWYVREIRRWAAARLQAPPAPSPPLA